MKIMLVAINAKFIHSNLAIYSLYSFAKEYQKQIVLSEYTINQRNDEILKDIYREKPDILGFSCYIWNISHIIEVTREIRKILPQTKIWLGGPEVSYDAMELIQKYPFIDGIICGEGEKTFNEIAGCYCDSKPEIGKIKGIVWRDEVGNIFENEQQELIDLDDIPFIYEQLPVNKIVYYESSRGCPFACSYCLSSVDKRLRFKNIEIIKRELQYFLDAKVPQVKFVDRTFNCKHQQALAIWNYLKEHDNGITNFHFEISADMLNDEEVVLLNSLRTGQVQLEIGVQSTNQKTLAAINRTMNFAKLQKRVREVAKGKNVHQHLDLIVGLPHEDYDSFKRSFNDVYALEPQQLQLGFLKVLKGSYMEQQVDEYECEYTSRAPYEVLQTKWLSFDDILNLKKVEEMVEVYYNSAQFTKTIPRVVKLFASPFVFYQELGNFYERCGYEKVSHARMRRYDILLEFLKEVPHINLAYFKELMLFDLYAREKLKKRPEWARQQNKEGQQYNKKRRNAMIHTEAFQYDLNREEAVLLTEPIEIVFDYSKRDVLTKNAKYY